MYSHKVQYYETDRMGFTHHSNYIRWMEEARINYLEEIGYGYDRLEEEGIISPVVSVNCNYKKTTTFSDVITIDTKIKEFNGVKLVISYDMTNANGDLVCQAESVHCFLNAKGMPVRLKKEFPLFYETMINSMK